ncbi:hypothetical protein [Streptomyces buecherae]|uniref:hypothetical protein n=1 Tax=Streptomyces buecherae TaxID=2763006 RepID=UPI003684EFD4
MRGTDSTGGWRHRWRSIGLALLLMAPLLGVTAANRPVADEVTVRPADAPDTRVAYAGTRHRSLGQEADNKTSSPLFGVGIAHYDVQPNALGDQLVFVSRRDERRPQVYLRAADGSVRRLTSGHDAAHPRLTPDGQAVVFDSAESAGPGDRRQRDLWLVRVDGSGLTRLTGTPANEEWPTVSPDGQRLAYTSDGDPLVGRQAYVRPLAGGAAKRFTDPVNGTASDLAWNPVVNGAHRSKIAYTATGSAGPRLRWTTESGGGGDLLLFDDEVGWQARGAAWLPDGKGFLFISPEKSCVCKTEWEHVYKIPDIDKQPDEPELVLDENREVGTATWLEPLAGRKIVVDRTTAVTKHTARLQDIRMDGSDPRDLDQDVLTEDPRADGPFGSGEDPLFRPEPKYHPWFERQNYTPDGRQIAFTQFEGKEKERTERILIAGADGSNARHLELAGRGDYDWDTDPTFSPDGKSLAFSRTSPDGTGGRTASRVLIADAATGAIRHTITPPDAARQDAQPTWSPDGATLAFTRTHVADDKGSKHIWTVPVNALDQQRDLSATVCPDPCAVIDDSPAFSPDGTTIVFNRKDVSGDSNEHDGLLLTSVTGGDCRVLLPASERDQPGACEQPLPETSVTGPFQPRDAAWTADGENLVFSSRADSPAYSPEKLRLLNIDSGVLTSLTDGLPGRQKEPTVQRSVDLAVRAPDATPEVTVGRTRTFRVDVVNHGPAASPGTRLTVAPAGGVRLTGLGAPGRSCDAAGLTCDLGVVRPGDTVPVTVSLAGVAPGHQPVDWSVTGAVLDANPSDNADRTLIPVREAPVPPEPTPTPTPTPTPPTPTPTTAPPSTPPPSTPAPPPPPPPPTQQPPPPPSPQPPPPPPAEPPAPRAGPAVSVRAQPNPGYVGGRVVVTYTVRNGRQALATGLRLRIGLPAGVPNNGPPPGCDADWRCALPDLRPGARTVLQVVLSPRKALTTQVTGQLTTTGTDADLGDNSDRERLRILQPRIIAVPAVGKPGFVTSVRGRDFPPGVPVRFRWKPGITAAAAPTIPKANGTFIGQLLILAKDQTGPRTITASGPGFSLVRTDFLVIYGSIQPPDEVIRR